MTATLRTITRSGEPGEIALTDETSIGYVERLAPGEPLVLVDYASDRVLYLKKGPTALHPYLLAATEPWTGREVVEALGVEAPRTGASVVVEASLREEALRD